MVLAFHNHDSGIRILAAWTFRLTFNKLGLFGKHAILRIVESRPAVHLAFLIVFNHTELA